MLQKFWKERIDDYDLRNKIGLHNSLDEQQIEPLLEQIADMTEGLSGRSLMQFANGALLIL